MTIAGSTLEGPTQFSKVWRSALRSRFIHGDPRDDRLSVETRDMALGNRIWDVAVVPMPQDEAQLLTEADIWPQALRGNVTTASGPELVCLILEAEPPKQLFRLTFAERGPVFA